MPATVTFKNALIQFVPYVIATKRDTPEDKNDDQTPFEVDEGRIRFSHS